MRKIWVLVLLSTILVAGEIKKEEVFKVTKPPILHLKITSGKIVVKQWGRKEVKVSLKVKYWNEKPEVKVYSEGNDIYVNVKNPTKFCFFCSRKSPKAFLELYTPEDYSGKISTVSADIYLEGKAVYLYSSTVSGDVLFNKLTGKKIKFRSVSGNIRGKSISCDSLFVETVSGDVSIKNFVSPELKFETVSGDIRLGTDKADFDDGIWKLSSVSGDIEIYFSHTPKISYLKTKTLSGDIRIGKQYIKGTLREKRGEKGIDIKISSISGDVDLKY